MKALILGIILSMNLSVVYAGADASTKAGVPGEELGDIKQFANVASTQSTEIKTLAERICAQYGRAGNKVASNVKSLILEHIKKYEGLSSPTVPQIITFLNRNKDKLLCENGTKSYLMAAFDNGAQDELYSKLFFRDLLRQDKSVLLDVNAVAPSGPNGELQTVIDYMDEQLADPRRNVAYKNEVRSLRNMLTKHLGAKKFSELPKDAQQQYLAQYTH